jgi:hypothetical protein
MDDSATGAQPSTGEGFWERRCAVLLSELELRTKECAALRSEAGKAQMLPRVQEALQETIRERDTALRERDALQAKVLQLQKDVRGLEHRHQMATYARQLDDETPTTSAAVPSGSPSGSSFASQRGGATVVHTSAGPQLVFHESTAVSSLGFGKRRSSALQQQAVRDQGASRSGGSGEEEDEVQRVMRMAQDAAALDSRLGERADDEDEELARRFRALQRR